MERYLNKDITHCTQCPRHCLIDAPQCGRGRSFADSLKREGSEETKENRSEESKGGHYGAYDREIHREHYRVNRGIHKDMERGRRHGNMEPEGEDELSGLMRSCGHYLFHHGGRKNGQDRILHILSHRGEMSQRELQEILGIQPGSVSEILAKIEHAGYLIREKDEADKRRIVIKLTEEGQKRADVAGEGKDRDLFSALDEEQKEQLKSLLKLMLESWRSNED